jgi:hypothetical protein
MLSDVDDLAQTVYTEFSPIEGRTKSKRITCHRGSDDQELQAMTADNIAWDAAWRQGDFGWVTILVFKSLPHSHPLLVISRRKSKKVFIMPILVPRSHRL